MNDNEREALELLIKNNISEEIIAETKNILSACGELADTLDNPVVTKEEKHNIIKQIFPVEMQKFICNLSDSGKASSISSVLSEYSDYCLERKGSIKAQVRYVT